MTARESLQYRHGRIQAVLARFRAAKPVERVKIILYPCTNQALGSMRGFCKKGEERPTGGVDTKVCASLHTDEIEAIEQARPIESLVIGDFLHIVVQSDRAGFLHLFNFGTSGDVARLFPHHSDSAIRIPQTSQVFVTATHGRSPFSDEKQPYREVGDSVTDSLGNANGYPERLLAIVTSNKAGIAADGFDPEWSCYATRYRGATGWDQVFDTAEERASFWTQMPLDEWEWGLLEVPVVEG